MHRLILSLSAAGCLIAVTACGDGVQRFDPRACDPVENVGCPDGRHCRLVAGGQTDCLPPVNTPAGLPCQPGACPVGLACVRLEGALGCHPVCAVDGGGCPGDGQCAYRAAEDGRWGLCAPHCTLDAGCGPGLTCAPTAGLDHLVCAAIGPAEEGAPCDEQTRCAAGLACLLSEGEPACHRLCDPQQSEPCPTGACVGQIVQVADVGYCTGG